MAVTGTIGSARNLLALACAAIVGACAGATVEPPLATGSVKPNAEVAAASARPAAARADARVAKVALLLPLSASGQTAAVAKGMKQAGELALFDSGSQSVQLIVKDDKGTPQGAAAAAEEAVQDGAELIIGPLFSASVKAVEPAARRANIPVLAFSNDPQVAGRGTYLVSFAVDQDIDRIVAYSIAQGRKRFAALLPDDGYGRGMADAFRNAVSARGGVVKGLEFYPTQANAMLEPARRLVDAMKRADEDGESVEAVFLPGGPDVLPSLGPLVTYAGMDVSRVKLIGTGAWDFPGIGREAAFVGGWYPAPEPRGWQDFSERFGRTFGAAPPRIASLAYDAVTMAVQMSTNPAGARFTAANLTRPTGFSGADGPLRLKADGLAERGLAVLEVQKMGVNVLEPAPSTFAPARLSARGTQPVN